MAQVGKRLVAQNRRARHDYQIEETFEAGLVLTGTEVKSLRTGRASIGESHASEEEGEVFLINANIPIYEATRPRKLRLKQREMAKLHGAAAREGYTLVPLRLYFTPRGIAKLELGLARGKRQVDKRETEKKRDWQRQKARLMRERG